MKSVYEQRRQVRWLYVMVGLALAFHVIEATVFWR